MFFSDLAYLVIAHAQVVGVGLLVGLIGFGRMLEAVELIVCIIGGIAPPYAAMAQGVHRYGVWSSWKGHFKLA